MHKYKSTKKIDLGSCCFRQPNAKSHCRFLHGYNLYGKFWFEANELDENNWVVDFGSLKILKNILGDLFDHKTVIDKNDPYLADFQVLNDNKIIQLVVLDGVGIEKFSELCYNASNSYIGRVTGQRCWVSKVEVFEHENNSAIYEVV